MHNITLDNGTYDRLQHQAESYGFKSVSEYLTVLAQRFDDGFVMTPVILDALDKGLEDIRLGKVVTLDQAKKNIEEHKLGWREGRAHLA
jgi:predicted transcriptional regulator